MAKKRVDAKAKAKRQRMLAIGGCVLLIGILAIQVPRTMKMLNPAPVTAPSETAVSTPLTPPTGTAPSAATLADAALVPAPEEGQLVSFELFTSKDPFIQQVKSGADDEGDSGSAVPDGGALPLPPDVAPLPPDVVPPATVPAGDTGSGSPTGAPETAPTSAVIAVNGVQETVAVGTDFPKDDPLFTLVAMTATTAEIAIAGGSYQDGASTVTLTKGKTLTLMNTTDGVRYEISLVALGSPEAPSTSE